MAIQSSHASDYTIVGAVTERFSLPPFQINRGDFSHTATLQTSDAVNFDQFTTGAGNNSRRVGNIFINAGYGAAHMDANVIYQRDFPSSSDPEAGNRFRRIDADGSAFVRITDLIITGPAPVLTSFRMHLDGSLQAASTFSMGSNAVFGQSSVGVDLTAGGTNVGSGAYRLSSTAGNFAVDSRSGLLSNFDGDDVLTSNNFVAQVNTPFTVTFRLDLSLSAGMNDDNTGSGSGIANFGNTLSFATDGPVFNLPPGYTVNSVSAGIVNNHFVLVPEPSSVVCLIVGAMLLTIGARVWSRRRRV